ncbi:hypothetical protein SynRS9909_01381 [Synechococcus sp. RS9909]|nr:hypothetical protein SynRS9909_01381 [Synechococcus sp. RS9909]
MPPGEQDFPPETSWPQGPSPATPPHIVDSIHFTVHDHNDPLHRQHLELEARP